MSRTWLTTTACTACGSAVALAERPHCIALDHFNASHAYSPGGHGLQLEYEGPGIERQAIPGTALSFEGR